MKKNKKIIINRIDKKSIIGKSDSVQIEKIQKNTKINILPALYNPLHEIEKTSQDTNKITIYNNLPEMKFDTFDREDGICVFSSTNINPYALKIRAGSSNIKIGSGGDLGLIENNYPIEIKNIGMDTGPDMVVNRAKIANIESAGELNISNDLRANGAITGAKLILYNEAPEFKLSNGRADLLLSAPLITYAESRKYNILDVGCDSDFIMAHTIKKRILYGETHFDSLTTPRATLGALELQTNKLMVAGTQYTVPKLKNDGDLAEFLLNRDNNIIHSREIAIGDDSAHTITLHGRAKQSIKYLLPDIGKNSELIIADGAQTLYDKILVNNILADNINVRSGNSKFKILFGGSTSATYQIPDVGASARFVMSHGNETAEIKSITSGPRISFKDKNMSKEICALTIEHDPTNNSREKQLRAPEYTIPDVGEDAKFIMSRGKNTIDYTDIKTAKIKTAIVDVLDIQGELRLKGARVRLNSTGVDSDVILNTAENQFRDTNTFLMPTYFKEAIIIGNAQIEAAPGRKAIFKIPTSDEDTNFIIGAGDQKINGELTVKKLYSTSLQLGKTLIQGGQTTNKLSIPDLATPSAFVLTNGAQTLNGATRFAEQTTFCGRDPLKIEAARGTLTIDTNPTTDAKYTIPDVGAQANFIMSHGKQIFNNSVEIYDTLTLSGAHDLIFNSKSAAVSVHMARHQKSARYVIPNVGDDAQFIMSGGNQIINGDLQVANLTITQPQIKFGDNLITSSAPLSKRAEYIIPDIGQHDSATFIMSSAAAKQKISTDIIFDAQLTLNKMPQFNHNKLNFNFAKSNVDIIISEPILARTYHIPDAGTNAKFIMSAGKQKIDGEILFGRGLVVENNSEPLIQITRNGIAAMQILAPGVGNHIYTIPNNGVNSSFIMSIGDQTISGALGAKTMSAESLTFMKNGAPVGHIEMAINNEPAAKYTIPNVGKNSTFLMAHGEKTLYDKTIFREPIISQPNNDAKNAIVNHFILSSEISGTPSNALIIAATVPKTSQKYTIPDVGCPADFIMSAGDQTFQGKITAQRHAINATENQISLHTKGGANIILTTDKGGKTNSNYIIPYVGADESTFIMAHGKQIIYDEKIFTRGVTLLEETKIKFGKNNKYAFIEVTPKFDLPATYKIPDVSSSEFIMAAGTQTIDGTKIFADSLYVSKLSNQIILQDKHKLAITTSGTFSGPRQYTISDVGTNANFIMSEGTQDIKGCKIFSQPLTILAPEKQLMLFDKSGNMAAIGTSGNYMASRIYTIADCGADAQFVMSRGYQAIEKLTVSEELTVGKITGDKLTIDAPTTIRNINTGSIHTPIIKADNTLIIMAPETLMQKLTVSGMSPMVELRRNGTTNGAKIIADYSDVERTYTIPRAGRDANFIISESAQKISGAKTFTDSIILAPNAENDNRAQPHIILNDASGNQVFITTAGNMSGSRTYTIPDFGGNGVFSIIAPDRFGNLKTVNSDKTTFDLGNIELPKSSQLYGNIRKGDKIIFHDYSKSNTNLFVGINSGNFSLNTATDNIGLGTETLHNISTSNKCIAIGNFALTNANTGSNNIAIGYDSGRAVKSGKFNTLLGNSSGGNLVDGSHNILIGPDAGDSLINESGNIYIGSVGVSGENNTIRIGENAQKCFIDGIYGISLTAPSVVYMNSAGQLGTMLSSARFKSGIKTISGSLQFVNKLNPVSFYYKSDKTQSINYGLIAEEVEKINPSLVVYDGDGKPETVQYHALNAFLIDAIKEQTAEFNKIREERDAQTQQIAELRAKLDEQAAQIAKILEKVSLN